MRTYTTVGLHWQIYNFWLTTDSAGKKTRSSATVSQNLANCCITESELLAQRTNRSNIVRGHKSVFYRNGWTNRAGFWHVSFLPHATFLYTVLKGNSVISKNKGTSIWNFVLNFGLIKFRHGISIVETCYQLSSRKVDAQSVINWAVVGQLSR